MTKDFLRECEVADPDGFMTRCEELLALLAKANETCNLTRIVEHDEFMEKHVADSLAIALDFPEFAKRDLRVADIGCGAGFPSLVLAMAFPNLRVTSIDSTGKKVAFVERTSGALGLGNLTAVHGRANELNRMDEYRGRFDVVTARAVAPSWRIAADTSNFPSRRGRFIFYKTPEQATEELPELRKGRGDWKWSVTNERVFSYGTRCFVLGER
ncbi:MAG: 16S rRNA (guanine(527)-N(7))-methyltransferase RsmG [Victivallaceae bacterium]|nr:16S rRNA (guanine(527)-N(7))-methyltransferase RsmG [Victivallaceae bacterium]